MIRGLYIAATGMLAEQTRADITANNLANLNTGGYKKDVAVFRSFPELLVQRINDPQDGGARPVLGSLSGGAVVDEVLTSFAPGVLKETGQPLDLALEGGNFFVLQTPAGLRYTRNGAFTLDGEGYIVNSDGYRLLGENGPIQVRGQKIEVNRDGTVVVDGQPVDRLLLVSFANPRDLQKAGNNLFIGVNPQPAVAGRVLQGYLEGSNVNAITEMIDMITIMRAYEANQRMIQAQDSILDKAVNQVGSLR